MLLEKVWAVTVFAHLRAMVGAFFSLWLDRFSRVVFSQAEKRLQ